jgi:uncharacterized membrane protein
MQSAKFRRILRQEADRWRSEGWIESDFYDRLAERYRFAEIEAEASGTFITALIGLGGILIGLGILSFVAANWQYLGKAARIAILLAGFLVINIGGFQLWQRANSRRLGQGLLLLGAIILGADMALLAQLFQISGDTFILFMGWSIGVVLMAYALGLTSLGVMAIALMGCGYWGAAAVGWDGRAIAPLWARNLYEYMPLFSVMLFLPLAYRCRSSLIFLLGAIAWLSSFQVAATAYTFTGSGVDRPAVVLGCSLPPLLLWATGRIQAQFPSLAYRERMAQLSQRLGVFSGGLTCFVLSLDNFIPEVLRLRAGNANFVDSWPLDRLLLLGLAIGLWIWLGRLAWPWTSKDRLMLLLGLGIAGLLTAAGFLGKSSWLPALFFVLLAILTLVCIQTSLQMADRGAFYFGWLLLVMRILTWFTFTQTDLMLKSLLFILSGVATIALGWWFERRLRQAQ